MILRQGSSGQETLDLQNKLKQLGYTIDTDSVYGAQTADAVRKFQKDAGIGVDGIAGNETMTALNARVGGNTATVTGSTTSSDSVARAQALLEEHKANKPADFSWDKQAALDKSTEAWLNREDFIYDLSRDPFYQQYREQYAALGNLAMQDAMGQAVALTGGYGNSYAQTVGQQAYNQYMQQLQQVVPELYSMARQNYNEEGQQLLNEISLLEAQRQTAYGEHQDQISQWQNWLNYLNSDAQYQEQMAYQKERDAIADAQWERQFAASRSSGGGGGSGGGGEAETLSTAEYKNWRGLFADAEDNEEALSGLRQQLAGMGYSAEADALYKEFGGKDTGAKTKDFDGVAQFKAAMPTRREFSRFSGQYDSYESYIDEKLQEWTINGTPGGNTLTDDEVLALMELYGLT